MKMTKMTTLGAAAALLLSIAACDSNKTPAEANKEAQQALDEHAKKVDEAKKEPTASQKAAAIDDANEELAEDMKEAYEGVDAKAANDAKAADGSDDQDGASDDAAADGDERFTLLERETKEEFAKRASAQIKAIDEDLERAKSRNAPSDEVKAVQDKLAEARKDLEEVKNGSDKLIDDGKTGVTVAINSARRKLDRIERDLADK